jgi:hypothetical protein
MNACTLTGVAVADSQLCKMGQGRELITFDVHVGGSDDGSAPHIRCSYFLATRGPREIKSGQRVLVVGALRYRRDSGFFVAVHQLAFLERDGERG